MIRSPSSVIHRSAHARRCWATPTGGSSHCATAKTAGIRGALRPSFWLALALSVAASPGVAQQAERARALQKLHREALQVQQQFQERLRAEKLDEAYTLSKR